MTAMANEINANLDAKNSQRDASGVVAMTTRLWSAHAGAQSKVHFESDAIEALDYGYPAYA
jgi:hypothetical protein